MESTHKFTLESTCTQKYVNFLLNFFYSIYEKVNWVEGRNREEGLRGERKVFMTEAN